MGTCLKVNALIAIIVKPVSGVADFVKNVFQQMIMFNQQVLKNSVDVNSILKKYPNCKYEKGSLEIPVRIWDECDLKSSDASDGSYTSYCAECENLLLISVWFME